MTLSPRKQQVLELIWAGFTNKQIGQRLKISVKTVEAHRAIILRDTKTGNTAQLLRYGLINGLIHP